MATAQLAKSPAPFTIAPITYEVQKEMIAKLADEYMPLTVASVDDKSGLECVHAARMEVKNLRVKIERRRKELKAESLEYGRQVDSAAKELTDLLTPIEVHLEKEEAIVAREKARIQREAEEKRAAMVRSRLQSLAACGETYLASDVQDMPQQQFDGLLADKQREKRERDEAAAKEADERARVAEQNRVESERLAEERAELERQRKEQEAAAAEAKRKEDDRLASERAELERVRKDQAAAQAKIDAKNKRIADAESERVRRAEIEKARAEAAEKARLEAEAKQQRDAATAKAKAEADEAERVRIEGMRPDNIKLLSVADVVDAIVVPEVSRAAGKTADEIRSVLRVASNDIRALAESLVKKRK